MLPEAGESKQPPPPDLVRGEALLWKMADVKGFLTRRLITGYLVTSYRCFIWDVQANAVRVNVPIGLADVAVLGRRQGKRGMRGGSFIVPKTADYIAPAMGEPVEVGDLTFQVEGQAIMIFRDVSEPLKLKALVDALRTNVRVPEGLGVDILWRNSVGPADLRG